MRHRRNILLCLILSFLLKKATGAILVTGEIQDTDIQITAITDFLVATDNPDGRATAYIADANSGAIFVAENFASDSVPLDQFQPFFKSSLYPHPVALAYEHGTLFVCDSEQGVFAIDIKSHEIHRIWDDSTSIQPVSIAVSKGRIVIADGLSHGIFWSSPGDKFHFESLSGISKLSRIRVSEERLTILDRNEPSRLLELPFPDAVHVSDAAVKVVRTEPGLQDFTVSNGIYHLSTLNNVMAVENSPSSVNALPVRSQKYGSGKVDALYVQNNNLYLGRLESRRIDRLPLPIPAQITIWSNSPKVTSSLFALYDYLRSRQLLPTREIKTNRRYSSAEELLLEQHALIWPGTSAQSAEITPASELLCSLNPSQCPAGGEQLESEIPANTVLTIPALEFTSFLSTTVLQLSGEITVADYINQQISPGLRSLAKKKTVYRLDQPTVEDLPAFFESRGFLPLSVPLSSSRVHVGLLINASKTHSVPMPLEDASDCLNKLNAMLTSPFKLPSKVQVGLSSLRAANGMVLGVDWGQKLAGNAEIGFEDASLLQLSSYDLQGDACGLRTHRASDRIINSVVTVVGLKYKLFNSDGSLVIPTPEQLRGLANSLSARADPARQWSILIDSPVALAYTTTAARAANGVPSSTTTKVDSSAAFPTDSHGSFVVPAEVWQTRVLVWKTDIDQNLSELMRINDPINGISILSTSRLRLSASSSSVTPQSTDDTWEAARNSYHELLKTIHYEKTDLPDSMADVRVAVAEMMASIDTQHIAFWDDNGQSSLYNVANTANGVLSSVTRVAANNQPQENLPDFHEDTDHGTHVIGLLASRSGKLGPGLIPDASVVLLDSTNLGTLSDSIERSSTADVRLFNFSFTNVDDGTLDNLKAQMKLKSFALFVASAGNDGKTLSSSYVPIGWADDIPNLLGVAAAEKSGQQKLGQWRDQNGILHKGTNGGRRYVQVLAPGESVYSTTHNNGYSQATGSSEAVPQVVAAAAVLFGKGYTEPLRIKQRLMYTADWSDNFDQDVWGGGFLNFHRATWRPDVNLWQNQTSPATIYSFIISGTPSIQIVQGQMDEAVPAPGALVPSTLPFNSILRITTQADMKFRVVYQDVNAHFKVIKNALLQGTVTCTGYQQWNKKSFVSVEQSSDPCFQGGIDIVQAFDYTRRMPSSALF